MLQLTFTFVCGFIQDGLGRHNLAIPARRRKQNTGSLIGYVTEGQQEKSAPIICIAIMPYYLRLHAYRCKLEFVLRHKVVSIKWQRKVCLTACPFVFD